MAEIICDYDFCKHYEDGRCGLDAIEICGGHCQVFEDKHGALKMTISNPCYHCFMGAIGWCLKCPVSDKPWSKDLEHETIEVEDDTIDEVIRHCEEDAEKIGGNPQSDRHAERCRQLAKWLTEYKALREENTAPSDFEAFKKFFERMGIKYEIPSDNLIYLSGFEVNSSQLIVVKFYDNGKFQEFCPYPEEGLTKLKDLREENKVLTQECDRLIKEKGELLKKSEHIAEYKRLLNAAVEDVEVLAKAFVEDEPCGSFTLCSECPLCAREGCSCKVWRYKTEALKLIGDEDV